MRVRKCLHRGRVLRGLFVVDILELDVPASHEQMCGAEASSSVLGRGIFFLCYETAFLAP